jgi:hypothetical protein
MLTWQRTDSRTTLLQQVYNNPLTWGGLHSVWGPPHVRRLLYTCCKSDVFLSFFLFFSFLVYAARKLERGKIKISLHRAATAQSLSLSQPRRMISN